MIRFTVGADGRLVPDAGGKMKGRGAYLCPDEGCLAKAVKKRALARTLRAENLQVDIDAVRQMVVKIQTRLTGDSGRVG